MDVYVLISTYPDDGGNVVTITECYQSEAKARAIFKFMRDHFPCNSVELVRYQPAEVLGTVTK